MNHEYVLQFLSEAQNIFGGRHVHKPPRHYLDFDTGKIRWLSIENSSVQEKSCHVRYKQRGATWRHIDLGEHNNFTEFVEFILRSADPGLSFLLKQLRSKYLSLKINLPKVIMIE